MRPSPSRFALVLLMAASSIEAAPGASTWADPTRPPGLAAAEGAASAARAARPASTASAAAPAVPQLQSVQVGTDGRASALVDGRLLQAGDALGSSRVVAIDAEGLTLRDARGRTARLPLITSSIAKRDGGSERPVAVAADARQPGREGQRP